MLHRINMIIRIDMTFRAKPSLWGVGFRPFVGQAMGMTFYAGVFPRHKLEIRVSTNRCEPGPVKRMAVSSLRK